MSSLDESRCDKTKDHEFHSHERVIETTCSGLTDCGEGKHNPHTFPRTVGYWCPGLCSCGLLDRIHGPGAHK